jgi:hypothetical protein
LECRLHNLQSCNDTFGCFGHGVHVFSRSLSRDSTGHRTRLRTKFDRNPSSSERKIATDS